MSRASWGKVTGMVIAFLIICAVVAVSARAYVALAPPIPCTMENRLDIFVDEDNIMWACECEALKTMHICHWQVIGGVESTEARKYLRRHHIILRHGPRGWSYTIKPMYIRIAA